MPLSADLTDRELVAAAKHGDTAAFDALFYRYRDGIFRVAVAITRDPSTGEEIVVDTFARAYRALERLEPDSSLRPWLYRVAVNLAYSRKPRRGVTLASLETSPEEAFATEERSPASQAELEELRQVVLGAIESLGDKHRVVVVLHYLSGLNLSEISEIVECPVGTVKSRLHYALRRLKERLLAHPGLDIEPERLVAATEGRMELQGRHLR